MGKGGGALAARLRGLFGGRQDAPVRSAAASARGPGGDAGTWLYFPPVVACGMQQMKVVDEAGYDFARLVWWTCDRCRVGLVGKIRVTSTHQRCGYGTRMLLRAMLGRESYAWTTTPQSHLGREFFPALARVTGAALTATGRECEHMRAARGRGFGEPLQETPPAPASA